MADDKKFGNNDFEDIYSSSEKNGYEDIYSDSEEEGRAVSSDKKGDDDFEDFFTGRDDKSDNVEYENETPVPRHREINTSPEVKPYSLRIFSYSWFVKFLMPPKIESESSLKITSLFSFKKEVIDIIIFS